MRSHALIWSIALAALIAAGGAALLRINRTEPPARMAQTVIEMLEWDPDVNEPDTQSLLRAVAVAVDQGRLNTAEGYYLLALQHQRELNVVNAEAHFLTAIALAPDWARPRAGLGVLLARHTLGRTEEAIAAFERAIELAPEWGKPYNHMAIMLRRDGRLDEAEEFALRALEYGPEDIAAHNNYANLLVTMGRLEESEPYYHNAIDLNPWHPKPYYNLACVYSLLGYADEALHYLGEAIKLAPALRLEAEVDPDLDPIRDEPAFQELVRGDEAEFDGPSEGEGGDEN